MSSIQDNNQVDGAPRIPYQIEDEVPKLNSISTSGGEGDNTQTNNLLTSAEACNIPKVVKTANKWWSIRLIYCTMFIYAISFTIVITNVYPYLRTLNSNADKRFYGWVVASFSIGQLLSASFFGLWYHYRSARETFIFALITSFISNILYSYAHVFPPSIAIYIILLTRFSIGFAFGSASVMRAFISASTTEEERTGALANLNATRSVGFLLGPVIGFAFQPLSYPGYTIPYIQLKLDLYTCPGYLCAILNIVNLILFVWFREVKVNSPPKPKTGVSYTNEETPLINETQQETKAPPFDKIAVVVCLLQVLIFSIVWTSFETLITPYSMDEFAWTNQKAILNNNIIFAINGVLALIVITSVKYLVKYFQERTLHLFSLLMLAISIYIFIPWAGDFPLIKPELIRFNNSVVPNATEAVGCDYARQAWCVYVPKLREFQFWLAPILFSLTFPMGGILLITIFSKITGPHSPGFMMGLFTSIGALARIAGPVSLSHLYVFSGPQITYTVIVGVAVVSVLLDLIFFTRLIPFSRRYPAFKRN